MFFPEAPSPEKRVLFLDSGRLSFYLISSASTLALFIGMILFMVLNPQVVPYTLFVSATVLYLIASYAVGFWGRDFDSAFHLRLLNKYFDRSAGETVDLFLPVCGEPLGILENTWNYVMKLRRVHEGDLRVHVLDDGKSDAVRAMADRYRFNYIRREGSELKKAGNLRHAFALTSAPFIVILDADFCPSQGFLLNTLPYMYEDEKCAILQTPQFFSVVNGQTRVQQGAGAIQELFYRLIQVSRDTFGGAICVGTNAIYRREALEPFGGTAAIGYSEDVRTGFQCLRSGWKVKYIPVILAEGTCPETYRQFFTQQYRWAMGSLSLMTSGEFWKAKITKMQRVCYMTGMGYYLTTGMSVLMAFVPSIYMLIVKPEFIHWFNLMWSIPSLLFTNLYMRYWQKTRFTWSAVETRQVSYWAHLFAMKDLFRVKKEEWVPTNKVGNKSRNFNLFTFLMPAHTLFVVAIVLSLVAFRVSQGMEVVNFIPLVLLVGYHVAAHVRVIAEIYSREL